jgi:hypothetical protein
MPNSGHSGHFKTLPGMVEKGSVVYSKTKFVDGVNGAVGQGHTRIQFTLRNATTMLVCEFPSTGRVHTAFTGVGGASDRV